MISRPKDKYRFSVEDRMKTLRKELGRCSNFMVIIHHFDLETIQFLQIMKDDYSKKWRETI